MQQNHAPNANNPCVVGLFPTDRQTLCMEAFGLRENPSLDSVE